jgi:hypothetical protein
MSYCKSKSPSKIFFIHYGGKVSNFEALIVLFLPYANINLNTQGNNKFSVEPNLEDPDWECNLFSTEKLLSIGTEHKGISYINRNTKSDRKKLQNFLKIQFLLSGSFQFANQECGI